MAQADAVKARRRALADALEVRRQIGFFREKCSSQTRCPILTRA